jgi:NitT/TauT family transport system permease protein
VLPFVIMSQTVPIVAFAPLVSAWGGKLKVGSGEWQPWMSVATISAFLAFAPMAVGLLRGLQAAPPAAVELMRSLAANSRATLWKLRLPAAVPFLIPALRLAAAGAVVGAIVAEISLGRSGGIGRLTFEYSRAATSDPAKVYVALVGAAVLGLAMALLVGVVDAVASRGRPESAA